MSQYKCTARFKRGLFATLFLLLVPLPVLAHVKWFSAFTFTEKPLMLQEILSPMFFWFAAGSILTIVILVYVDEKLTHTSWYHNLSTYLSRYAGKSNLIIRVATGAVLLLSWQSNALLVPELIEYNVWIELSQLALAILILSNRLIKYAGLGVILLYFIALFKFGAIHLLDYVYLVGAGYYLAVSESDSRKLKASALPALYASVGFSLCWVALEKIVYPGWALQILTENPVLTFGLDLDFFLMSAAFVEFSLGFLLIVCMLQRPIALAVTVLFMSTTLIFGKMEFIGHAIVHAVMIVFLLQGTGHTFRTPITFFKHIPQRMAFAAMSFTVILAILLRSYTGTAFNQYEEALAMQEADPHFNPVQLAVDTPIPSVALKIRKDDHSGWNMQVLTSDFVFAPEDCGKEHADGFGHAHFYLNGEKVARLYSPWYHIPDLPPGKHILEVTLNSNNHGIYAQNGQPIKARYDLEVEP